MDLKGTIFRCRKQQDCASTVIMTFIIHTTSNAIVNNTSDQNIHTCSKTYIMDHDSRIRYHLISGKQTLLSRKAVSTCMHKLYLIDSHHHHLHSHQQKHSPEQSFPQPSAFTCSVRQCVFQFPPDTPLADCRAYHYPASNHWSWLQCQN